MHREDGRFTTSIQVSGSFHRFLKRGYLNICIDKVRDIYCYSPTTQSNHNLSTTRHSPQPLANTYSILTASMIAVIGTGESSHLISILNVSFHPHPVHPRPPPKSTLRNSNVLPSLPTPFTIGSTIGVYDHPLYLNSAPLSGRAKRAPPSSPMRRLWSVAKQEG